MINITGKWNLLIKTKKGQSLVEYLFILTAVALAAIIGLTGLAGALVKFFNHFITLLQK